MKTNQPFMQTKKESNQESNNLDCETNAIPDETFYRNVTSIRKDYLLWSIFNLFFCCFWLALFSTIYSMKVRDLNKIDPLNPDIRRYSRNAFRINLVSTILGMILIPFIIAVYWYYLKQMKFLSH